MKQNAVISSQSLILSATFIWFPPTPPSSEITQAMKFFYLFNVFSEPPVSRNIHYSQNRTEYFSFPWVSVSRVESDLKINT